MVFMRSVCTVDRVQRSIPAANLLEDVLRLGGPDERLRVAVGLGEEAVDRRLPFDQGPEHAAPEPPLRQLGEEALDRVRRRGRGRGEVEGPARVPLGPGQDLGVLVGAVVVQDGVDEFAGRHGRLDGVQEAQELLVAVPLHAAAEHRAVEHVRPRRGGGAQFAS